MAPEPPWPVMNGIRSKLSGFLDTIGLPTDLISPAGTQEISGKPDLTWTTVTPRTGRLPRLGAVMTGDLPSSARLPVVSVVDAVGRLLRAGATYDVIHFDTVTTAHLVRPLRNLTARHGQQPTTVLSLNDSYSLLLSGGVRGSRLKTQAYCRYAKFVERRLLPAADFVDVVSEQDLAWLERLVPGARLRLVPLGVDLQTFRGPRLESRWDVLYLGALTQWAFDWLAAALEVALPVLRQRFPDIRVAAAGPDATDHALRFFRQHGVTYLGFVDGLSELLRSSRVLLVSSRQPAGTPTKALQAMAAGTPVVGMEALDGIPHGRDHVTYSRASNWTDLASRMDRLLTTTEYAARVGEGGRRLVQARHAWPVVRQTYLCFPDGEPEPRAS